MQPDQEFITSVVVLGGIIFAGLLIVIGLSLVGIAIYKKKKETKFTFNGKEKQNGQAKKGGSQGHW